MNTTTVCSKTDGYDFPHISTHFHWNAVRFPMISRKFPRIKQECVQHHGILAALKALRASFYIKNCMNSRNTEVSDSLKGNSKSKHLLVMEKVLWWLWPAVPVFLHNLCFCSVLSDKSKSVADNWNGRNRRVNIEMSAKSQS